LLCFMRSLSKPVASSARVNDVQTSYWALSHRMQLNDLLVYKCTAEIEMLAHGKCLHVVLL